MPPKKATNLPVIHEGQALRVLPTPQLKLASIEDCRREMARVYRDARSSATDMGDASRLVYMLSSIAKLIEVGELEKRLTALESNHGNV